MKSLSLDFLSVTENAALSAYEWTGKGDEHSADKAATDAMRNKLNQIEFSGRVVIGEGEIDHAPMLYIGEKLGTQQGIAVDIAVDPIEGTTPTVNGENNGVAVIAAAPKGTLLHAPDMYMKKIIVGPKAKGKIDIQLSLLENMEQVATALDKKVKDLRIMIQNRPRHQDYIRTVRDAGAKVYLFDNNDVIASLLTCFESANIDMVFNIGGAPEGVISAVAIRALDGDMQAQLMPYSEYDIKRCKQMGLTNIEKPFLLQDLIQSDQCIFATTAITDNVLMKGVIKNQHQIMTESILITGSEKKMQFIKTVY